LKITDDGFPSDCVRDFSFGLVSFTMKMLGCDAADVESSKAYDSSSCSATLSMFDVSANSLCDRCRDAGITAEFFTALACLVGTLAFGMVVIRMFDKGYDPCKRWTTGLLLFLMFIFLVVA